MFFILHYILLKYPGCGLKRAHFKIINLRETAVNPHARERESLRMTSKVFALKSDATYYNLGAVMIFGSNTATYRMRLFVMNLDS